MTDKADPRNFCWFPLSGSGMDKLREQVRSATVKGIVRNFEQREIMRAKSKQPVRTADSPCVGSRRVIALALLGLLFVGCGREEDPPRTRTQDLRQRPRFVVQESERAEQHQQEEEEEEEEQEQAREQVDTWRSSRLSVYELKMAASDFRALEANPFSNETHPATFIYEGKTYDPVAVRTRGAFSRSWPKKSLKIVFDHNHPFQGQHSLNLNSGWRDPAFIREALGYHVYAACGAVASRSRIVRLNLNGKFYGLYVEVEQPGKEFLKRHGLKGAAVYKASSRDNRADERDLGDLNAYRAQYSKETQAEKGYEDLQQFCHAVEKAPNTLQFFNEHVDLEKYINYLVATTLTQNWDGYNKNHFIVHDLRGSNKWFLTPWDLDRTFGDHWNWSFDEARLPILLGTRKQPGVTGWNRLEERFFSEPKFKARFLNRLQEMLEQEFTKEKLFPLVDQLEVGMATEAHLDRQRWPGSTGNFHSGIAGLKRFIEQRRAYLLAELPRLRGS